MVTTTMAGGMLSPGTEDQLFEALRELTVQPRPVKRPIGFMTPEDNRTPKARGRR